MPGSSIAVLICGALIIVASIMVLPRWWRGWFDQRDVRFLGRRRTHGEMAFLLWPVNGPIKRGLVRGLGVAAAGCWTGFLAAGLSYPVIHGKGTLDAVLIGIFLLLILFLFACFFTMITVILFNWPKSVVPPGRRDDPGALAEMRGAIRLDLRTPQSQTPRPVTRQRRPTSGAKPSRRA